MMVHDENILNTYDIVSKRWGLPARHESLDISDIITLPFAKSYGFTKHKTIQERAFILLREIILQRPFPDGNKRTALLVALTILQRNGYKIKLKPNTVQIMLDITQGKKTEYPWE